jgi:hypothetical protein
MYISEDVLLRFSRQIKLSDTVYPATDVSSLFCIPQAFPVHSDEKVAIPSRDAGCVEPTGPSASSIVRSFSLRTNQ